MRSVVRATRQMLAVSPIMVEFRLILSLVRAGGAYKRVLALVGVSHYRPTPGRVAST